MTANPLDLLRGLLGFQLGLVDRAEIVAALRQSPNTDGESLRSMMQETRSLDPSARSMLSTLAQQHVEMNGGDVQKSLAALYEVTLLQREVEDSQQGAADCLATEPLAMSDWSRADLDESNRPQAGEPRFRILRSHAKGGLGEVFVAEDEELNREVALKEIHAQYANHSEPRARFLLEAEITGRLEHPGVVPVYGLGRYEDGRPYYAMRFIHGSSLREALEQFDRTSLAAPKELRKLLTRFVDICNTIEYAHSRGVLHRDLKPDNVMLGEYGETLVVDWGLAKLQGNAETAASPRAILATSSDSAATHLGSAMGTPAYMSPEQAEGDLGALGPASDIYSLGATLYHVLSNIPPMQGGSLDEVLRKVKAGEVRPAREVDSSIPKPLEAICRKAMARRPEDRYASAKSLADDVESWLADEPVEAYGESMIERVSRWSRRHRAWTRAAAMALTTVAVVSLTAALIVNSAWNSEKLAVIAERTAKTNAQNALDAEKAARSEAKKAIDNYVDLVMNDELLKEKRFRDLRKRLLSDALAYYGNLTEQSRGQENEELADSLRRLGRINLISGSQPQARHALSRALGIYRRMLQTDPSNSELVAKLIYSTGMHAVAFQIGGDVKAAAENHLAVIDLSGKHLKSKPENLKIRKSRATAYTNLASLKVAQHDFAEALKNLSAGIADYEELVRLDPDGAGFASGLAAAHLNLGAALQHSKKWSQALASYAEAVRISEELVDQEKGDEEIVFRTLALAYSNRGVLYQKLGQSDQALESYTHSLETARKLAKKHPHVAAYKNDVTTALYNLAFFMNGRKDHEGAIKYLYEALKIDETLARDHPEIVEYRFSLLKTRRTLGLKLVDLQRFDEALEQINLAGELLKGLDSTYEERARQESGHILIVRTQTLRKLGRAEDAVESALEFVKTRLDDPTAIVVAARQLALCVPVVGAGEANLSAEQQAARKRIVELTLATLRQAIDAGWDDVAQLRSHTDFASMRDEPGFQKLIDRLNK